MELLDAGRVEHQLVRIFSSEQFRNSPRLQAFLRFIVAAKLDGKSKEIKESTIAFEVFGRETSFDCSSDSIVRSAARRLRSRLEEYYDHAGAGDSVRIEIPKGNYVPEIYQRSPAQPFAVEAERGIPRHAWERYAAIAAVVVFGTIVATLVLASRPAGGLYVARGEAYDYYTRGEYALAHHQNAVPLFQAALRADPDFASSYVGIAQAYATQAANDEIAPESALARAAAAAQTAIKLDPSSGRAHAVMGDIYYCQWKWAEADRQFRIATKLQPNSPEAWRWWTLVHFAKGQFELAEQSLKRAATLESGTLTSVAMLSQIYYYERNYDQAIAAAGRVLAVDHDNYLAHWVVASSLLQKGQATEALQHWRPMLASVEFRDSARRQWAVYEALSGDSTDLRGFVEDCAAKRTSYCSPWILAQAHALLADRESCFRYLRESVKRHDPDLVSIRFEPILDSIRGRAEYQEIVHELGL
ncbi:MAG: tetratricopeptide repeat protein [Acidobacteriaceae bacterium]|nr:tetratricopeptide repeat protein [Acidobacteriaceae bacterium]